VSRASVRTRALRAAAVALLLLLVAGHAPGAEPGAEPEAEDLEREALRAFEQELPPGFTGAESAEALLALAMLEAGRAIRARESAEALVLRNPDSLPGRVALGRILHLAEGNLALARRHLERALELYAERYGLPPREQTPWGWHSLAYNSLAAVHGDMGHDLERLEVLAEHNGYYTLQAEMTWTLARLGLFDEAREAAETALALEIPERRTEALIGLSLVESQLLNHQRAYARCLEAIASTEDRFADKAVVHSNAGEAALALLRFDDAERHYLDAAETFLQGTPANPWMELANLYVAQGRTGEARDAMREMFAWRSSQPANIDAQTRSAIDRTSGAFLLASGRPAEAARVARRGLQRPDRRGSISFSDRARAGGAALMDHVASRTAAEEQWERASWLPWREAWRARLDALAYTARSWSSGRQARALLAEEQTLLNTVLPYASASAIVPEWLQPELVALIGAGPTEALIRQAAARPEPVPGDEGYLRALEAEAAHVDGRPEAAHELAREALTQLPRAEVLLRARVAARGGVDALDAGRRQEALELLDRAVQKDPGVLRRLGIALPVVFEMGASSLAREASALLADSPRLEPADSGFRVRTRAEGTTVESCLVGPGGALHACARVAPEPGESEEEQARRLAAEFHHAALAPRVDLTQVDLDSLDGATTVRGVRGTDRARKLLSEWGLDDADDE